MLITESIPRRTDGGAVGNTVARVIVPIFTDDMTDQALGLAIDLSNHEQADLTIVGMDQVPEQTPLDHPHPSMVSQRRAQMGYERLIELIDSSTDITTKSRIGHNLAHMILEEASDGDDRTLIVMEQTEDAAAAKSLLSDPLESVFESGAADVVLTTGTEHLERIGSILVPITGGPHSGLAVDVARAIAAENDAWIELFHVIDQDAGDDDRQTGEHYLEAAEARLADYEQAATWLYEADDVVEAIIEQSAFYDITVIGAPRESRLRRFIFGSKTKEVRERAESTVITVHSKDANRPWYEAWLSRSA